MSKNKIKFILVILVLLAIGLVFLHSEKRMNTYTDMTNELWNSID